MADLRSALASALLDEILAAFGERGVRPSALAIISHATDRGASDELATELAELLQQRLSPNNGAVD